MSRRTDTEPGQLVRNCSDHTREPQPGEKKGNQGSEGMCCGCIWELWFEAVLPKAFLGWDIPSCVHVTAGQNTWQGSLGCVPAVSWLAAPPSAPMLPVRRNPGIKCGKSKLAVSCVPAGTAGSSLCVSSQPVRVVFMDLQVSRRKPNH